MEYTVGELAKRSGLTVRALHHYETLGLLPPSGRSQAGYRLYTERDVLGLHRILAYRQMGLALKDIAPLLGPGAPPLQDLLARQIATAEAELARQQRLLAMLRRVAQRAEGGGPELADQLLTLMSTMRTYERYYSEQELQQLQAMQSALSAEDLQRLRAEMDELIPAMREAMAQGLDPDSDPAVAALARRWLALGALFPEDEALRDKGRAMLAREPELQAQTGLTPALLDYVDGAVAAAKRRLRAEGAPA